MNLAKRLRAFFSSWKFKWWHAVIAIVIVLSVWYLCCLPRQLFDTPLSAVLESRDGTLLGARIAADGQWRFPDIDTVPEKFAKSIISYEDKRFRWHPGIDPLAVLRAVRLNSKAGEVRSGASTITMQTIRLSRGDTERSMGEKLVEAILATRLELRCSKNRILALYASNAPFGGNVVGLEAASWRYFGRRPDDLSWAESAMLAVLPNSPALIHPGKNREKLLAKRNFLLDKLCKEGIIDSDECALAKDEPLPDKPYPMPDIAHHYLETLRAQGGDKLYRSTLDVRMQQRAEEILDKQAEVFATNNVFNIAAVVLDVKSGQPLVYCGNVGHGKKAHGCDVDVVQASRSSGSTLKPFLYGAMLDDGQILPNMLISDIPFHYKDFSPHNFNHTFDGAVPACDVIRRSLNVPSVRMLYEYGLDRFITLLGDLGFTTITRGAETYGLSLILGGAEIKLGELAQAYRNLALELKEKKSSGTVLSPGAVWCTFETLTGVTRPEEEGDWQSFSSSRTVAWKTGTSYGNRDAWSVGVTPEYVVTVWVGNCDGEGRPLMTGVGYAAPVMFDLFSTLPPTSWFSMPGDMEVVATCPQSGHPVSDICMEGHDGEDPVYVTVPKTRRRPPLCPYHRIVHLDPDRQYQVDSECCSISDMVNVSWFVLPPAQEWYYMRSHSEYHQLPPLHPNFSGSEASGVIEIIYPQSGMSVAAPVALDSKSQGIVFSAAHSDKDATLFWHLDSEYLGETSHGEHKIKVVPTPGRHILTLNDPNGNTASVVFFAK